MPLSSWTTKSPIDSFFISSRDNFNELPVFDVIFLCLLNTSCSVNTEIFSSGIENPLDTVLFNHKILDIV